MKKIIFFFTQALIGLVLVALSLITAVILLPIGILFQLFLLVGFIVADICDLFLKCSRREK